MTTLIQRGAIALLKHGSPKREWDRLAPFAQRDYLEQSRAYLEAIREPTERMQDAGLAELGKGINRDLEILAIWDAMVGAELDTET